ncbi:hypothetical protein SpCBS45565_g00905 [Spizellomyces sp. 'palustris']|nr:hypothetical protein SpCBS45565_g00905 [Spizellomyces sp. 'palustris']
MSMFVKSFSKMEEIQMRKRNRLERRIQMPLSIQPLHKAILSRNFPTVDLLLSYDALTDVADNDGRTPWHVAACVGDVNILRKLLQISRGVAMVKDKHGRLPVDLANSEEIVVILQ